MSFEIFITPEAENDIWEAASWYEKNLNGLGKEFITSIDTAIDSIQQNPEAFPLAHKKIRRILLKNFLSDYFI